jgi:hypothetical protein
MNHPEYKDILPLSTVAELLDLPFPWLVDLARARRIPALLVGDTFYATANAVAVRLRRMMWDNVWTA